MCIRDRYGLGLIIYAVFDLVFFPAYYKNGYKAGKAFVIAAIPMLLLMVIVEGTVHIPALAWLDSYAVQDQLRQLPILLIGIVCYIIPVSYTHLDVYKRQPFYVGPFNQKFSSYPQQIVSAAFSGTTSQRASSIISSFPLAP